MKHFPTLLAAIVCLAPIRPCPAETGLARHKQLYAVPVPGDVVVNGNLGDWDLSGQIDMFVVSESKDTQSARFAVMYDSQAIYLSGVVRDTSPMMNRQDPKVKGDRGWDADSCQFRLTIDPAQPYPVEESSFDYRGQNAKTDTRDDIKHLTLWYYTDRAEPCLQMHMGMGFRLPNPAWAPHGVVPAGLFEAKYVKADDGRGYTFEYRIPWKTLDARAPLKGGDMVAGTVQFNWGTADGLKTGGGSAWAYDVMSGPGFVFQNAAVWGKLFFANKGNVPRELVEEGVPTEKPNPLEFAYDLPHDGQITLQLFDQEHLVRRIIVAQADRTKGRNVERWDGMDDQGKPLPAGTYTVRGIIHKPITSEFLFSVHNSGDPPYPTDDNKGGWGGDHGRPTACSALPDGMLLSWDGCEYGWGIIRVDLDGRKQWGIKTGALFLANDGRRFFVYDPHGFQATDGVQVFDTADGRPLNFGNGHPLLEAPAGGDETSNQVTGLACDAEHVYVSYGGRNLVAVFDSACGDLKESWQVPAPGGLAGTRSEALPGNATTRGSASNEAAAKTANRTRQSLGAVGHEAEPRNQSILAISDGRLVNVRDGKVTTLNQSDLDTPTGIAVSDDGTIFISNQGQRQDIALLDRRGKLLRWIGRSGGRPAVGAYETNGVYQPNGMAVDKKNRLWVAEHADAPKRVSVWNAKTGAFEREFFGGCSYFAYAHINPDLPHEIICHNVLWRADWEKKTATPVSTIWRKTAPDMIEPARPDGYQGAFYSFTADNGRQYALGGGQMKTIAFRRDGNLFKPFLAAFHVSRGWSLWRGLGIPELDDPDKTPDGAYLWQDRNDDQRVQMSEVYRFEGRHFRLEPRFIAPDLTIWAGNGYLLRPIKVLPNGQPVYDPEKLETNFLADTPYGRHYLWLDPDGSVYTYVAGERPSLARWTADGKLEWGYPGIVRWHDALSLPVVKAGRLHGLTGPLGVAGNFTGNMSYFGVCHIFQRDGIYAAAVMRDGRTGGMGPDIGQPEGQRGRLVRIVTRPGTKPRTLLLGAGQDGRITEIHGLDTIKPLPSWDFTLSEQDVKRAADELAAYNARFGINSRLTIGQGRDSLKTGRFLSKDLDATRGFKVRAARDDRHLFLRFEVNSPHDLINAATDPKLLFKGGNCLDVQIATDPAADRKRKTPAPGDVRLLATRQLDADTSKPKTFAILYRPKVKGFTGEPIVLVSPTGKESFDAIDVVADIALEYRKTATGFDATLGIPLDAIGLQLTPGNEFKIDVGYIFGNATGTSAAARAYWSNNSFTANVTRDVPHESRLEPAEWGTAVVE